jgi:glycosyltransferase involved in cell wall biosynthesis
MGAPQARLSELGECLIDLGWDVEALTALPNYPTGKVFEGYDTFNPTIEQVGRIRTIRVPLFTAKTGFTKRLRSYFSFVRNAKKYGPKLCSRPDLIFVESPPLFIGYAARYLARKWQCPFVFNVSDLWPESAIRMGIVKPGIATWLAERLELKLYRQAAAVTGQSQGIIDSVKQRSPNTITQLITNGVDPGRFGKNHVNATARQLVGGEPGPIFIYAGLLGWAQGIDQILDAAKCLPDDTKARFVIIGDGPERERLSERVKTEMIGRVKLLPAQSRDKIPALLAAADVAIITLGMGIPGAVPSKIYEAMASSLPIIIVAEGEAAMRVTQANAGIAVSPGDQQALIAAIKKMSDQTSVRDLFGNAARVAAESRYDRKQIAKSLDTFLRGLIAK